MANENNEWLLTASDLTVRYNTLTVLDGVSMTIQRGDRIGLVGHNGSGKSTFIRILAGVSQPDSGAVSRRKETIAGYLPQDFTLNSRLSVRENIRDGAGRVLELIREFESLPPMSSRHDALEQQIEVYDGWNLENRIETAMTRLNCPDGNSRIETLSGGEKRRVALCRALVMQPDLLILDEPTNHLDAESIEWLCEFLKGYPNAFLMVTHDRYFLDEITRSIVELSRGKFYGYSGNYTDYLIAKSEREALAEAEDQKRQSFLRRELEWVRTQPRARTTKSKSRLDRYFETAGAGKFESDQQADFVIPPAPPLGNKIVKLEGVGMELGGNRLFEGLDFNFEARHRIGVVGRNGLGKTTLLKIILGELEPIEGKVVTGLSTRFNYVDQGRLQLDEEKTVLEQISEGAETIPFGDQQLSARGYLKRFLFPDDRIQCQVKVLSGGERSRLLLARILKNGGNFLILDEPTNDLDLPTLRVLEEALVRFEGVVLAVSHDRYFLNRVCNGILAFEGNGRVAYSEGNYDYYLEKKRRAEKAFQGVHPSAFKKPAAIQRPSSTSKPRKLSYKETQELEGMEEAILEVEENIRRIEARFADPDFHRKHGSQTDELKEELETARATAARLYARWEELEAVRSGQ